MYNYFVYKVYNYFVSRLQLSDSLYGFLEEPSCCTALRKITEDWREALDERQTVSAVSIDLSKAFDTKVCDTGRNPITISHSPLDRSAASMKTIDFCLLNAS